MNLLMVFFVSIMLIINTLYLLKLSKGSIETSVEDVTKKEEMVNMNYEEFVAMRKQQLIDRRCDGTKYGFAPGQPIERVARQIINTRGNSGWGRGVERTEKLMSAGYDPEEVRKEINRLFNE